MCLSQSPALSNEINTNDIDLIGTREHTKDSPQQTSFCMLYITQLKLLIKQMTIILYHLIFRKAVDRTAHDLVVLKHCNYKFKKSIVGIGLSIGSRTGFLLWRPTVSDLKRLLCYTVWRRAWCLGQYYSSIYWRYAHRYKKFIFIVFNVLKVVLQENVTSLVLWLA